MKKIRTPEEERVLAQVGKTILRLRKLSGLSQEEFGKKINRTRLNISQIEKGETPVTIYLLNKIVEVLKPKLPEDTMMNVFDEFALNQIEDLHTSKEKIKNLENQIEELKERIVKLTEKLLQ